MTADLKSEKLIEHLNQAITVLNGWSQWAANKEANHRKAIVAAPPIPPKVEKTSGVNELISTSLTRCSYILCLARSKRLYNEDTAVVQ